MAAWHIICKDLLLLTRDRRALAVLLAMPMVFIAILGFSTGQLMGWQDENTTLRLAWVDRSGDELTNQIYASLQKRRGVEMVKVENADRARLQVDDGDRTAAVIVGSAFRSRIDALTLSDVLDPNAGGLSNGLKSLGIRVYARATRATAGAIVEQIVLGEVVRVIVPHVVSQDPLARTFLQARKALTTQQSKPIERETANTAQSDFGGMVYQFVVPAYAVLFAFFLINIMARSFISEAANGTLRRLHAAPIGIGQLLIGKTVPFLIVSIVQGLLLFLFGRLLFGMSWGVQPWLLLPVIVCTSLAATTLGLLTAVLVRTDAQVSAYANLLVITLAGLSGCFMPREWLPEMMRQVSLAIPHAWSLIAYDQILNSPNPNLLRIGLCCLMLIGFSAVFFVFGCQRFRRLAAE